MKNDYGFAPNPFWDYCTLATCTPNHMRCNLLPGDWILGNSTADEGNLLIYAMRISEVLSLDDYYHDERFARKRPCDGTWQDRCGDNIYFRDTSGSLVQDTEAIYHTDCHLQEQDIYGNRVFISDHYFYFGEDAPTIPAQFSSLIRRVQGVKYHRELIVDEFIRWLEGSHSPGLIGLPRDRVAITDELPI